MKNYVKLKFLLEEISEELNFEAPNINLHICLDLPFEDFMVTSKISN